MVAGVLVLLGVTFAVLLGVSQAGTALLGVLGWLVALAAHLPVLGSAGRLHAVREQRRTGLTVPSSHSRAGR